MSPVIAAREPKPRRVRNIFICSRVVFCASIKDDERVVQCPAAHEGQRRDFDNARFLKRGHLLGPEHIKQGIVKRAQIRVDLFGEIAGQEAELLARLDGGAGQDDAAHPPRVEHMHGHRHGKVGLAGSGRSHGKDHFVAAQRFQIGALGRVAGGDGLLGQGEHGLVTERAAQIRARIALKELEPLLQIRNSGARARCAAGRKTG